MDAYPRWDAYLGWIVSKAFYILNHYNLTSFSTAITDAAAILILLGGLFLVIRKVISARTPISFLATVAVLTFIFGGGRNFGESFGIMTAHLLSGGLMLGAIFMATDYTTSPVTKAGQVIMGIGAGIITTLIRFKGGYPDGVSYAILLMNVATPLIDKITYPKPFGHGKTERGQSNV